MAALARHQTWSGGRKMNVFVIHAQPEPKSFNATMVDHAVAVLTEQCQQLQVSNLYAMGLGAVSHYGSWLPIACHMVA